MCAGNCLLFLRRYQINAIARMIMMATAPMDAPIAAAAPEESPPFELEEEEGDVEPGEFVFEGVEEEVDVAVEAGV